VDDKFKMGVGEDPYIPDQRELPEHKIKRISARGGMVCVEYTVGNEDKRELITRSEAIKRAQSISEMAKMINYPDERLLMQNMVEEFIEATAKAKEQDGGKYTATSVSMANASRDPLSPLFTN
jgi:hypothetical protein